MDASDSFVYAEILDQTLEEFTNAVRGIVKYHGIKHYNSKQELLDQWDITPEETIELVVAIFTTVLVEEEMTIQALSGRLNHKIKLPEMLDRITILADVIGILVNHDLLDMYCTPGGYLMISSQFSIEGIPVPEKHVTLEWRPQPIEGNKRETGSVILGGSMNHHERTLRLSHLQRMGQISLCLNRQFIENYDEKPKKEPDDEDKEHAWERFKENSSLKYQELLDDQNKFYTEYGFDSRGRSYAGAYYLDPQGNSYKKAAIQLANKEVVTGV